MSNVSARCATCGSGVVLRDGTPVCMRDDRHGIAMGGPGSGWHAEQGHVPGSQGSTSSKPPVRAKRNISSMTRAQRQKYQKQLDRAAKLQSERRVANYRKAYDAGFTPEEVQAAVENGTFNNLLRQAKQK